MFRIFVPKGQSVVELLTSLGSSIQNSWIYFHENTIKEMLSTSEMTCADNSFQLTLEATTQTPESQIHLTNVVGKWAFCSKIKATGVLYKTPPDNPDKILFIEMEKD